MLAEKGEHRGVHVLGVFTHGPGLLFTKGVPVSPLSNLEGKKVRVAGNVTNQLAEAQGMVSIQAPSPQSYEILSGGIFLPVESVPFLKLDGLVDAALRAEGGLDWRGIEVVVEARLRFEWLERGSIPRSTASCRVADAVAKPSSARLTAETEYDLRPNGLRCVFARTGSDEWALPEAYRDRPRSRKPAEMREVGGSLVDRSQFEGAAAAPPGSKHLHERMVSDPSRSGHDGLDGSRPGSCGFVGTSDMASLSSPGVIPRSGRAAAAA